MVHIPLFRRTNNCNKIVKTISLNSRSISDAPATSVQMCSVLWKSNYLGCSTSDLTWAHEQNSLYNKEKWLFSWNSDKESFVHFFHAWLCGRFSGEARDPNREELGEIKWTSILCLLSDFIIEWNLNTMNISLAFINNICLFYKTQCTAAQLIVQ